MRESSAVLENVFGQKYPLWKLLLVGIMLLIAFMLPVQGRLFSLVALVGGAWLAVLSYYHPMPAIFALLLLSTNVLEFADMEHLPYWQMGPGLRMTLWDNLLIMMFGIAMLKLYLRCERPLFLKPMLLLAGMILIPFIFGLLLGTTDLDTGMNLFRGIFTYTLYFIIVASVDSPKRFHVLVGMVFVVLAASVAIQVVEAALGHRLSMGFAIPAYHSDEWRIIVEGELVPYIWNRALAYTYIGLFLALGATFSGIRIQKFLPLTLLGALGFVIALTRVWYLCILTGISMILALQREHRFRTSAIVVFGIIGLLGLIMLLNPLTETSYGGSLLDVWIGRLRMINTKTSSFVGRIGVWRTQLEHFMRSPLFGYGMGSRFRTIWSPDTGFINTLLQFGFAGLSAIFVLIVTVFVRGYHLYKKLEPSLERGYVIGILGLWVGMLVGYSFSWDFFSWQGGICIVTLAMAILDRIWFLYSEDKTTIDQENLVYQE